MTAQISDTIIYQNEAFCSVGINGEGLFNPINYGVKPFIFSTACYRGFYCTYIVVEDCLRLDKVYLGLNYKNSLLIKYGRGGQKLFGQLPHDSINTFGLHQYNGLNTFIKFTGGFLIGSDYIRELSSNMGYPAPYRFKKVTELIFQSGKLIKDIDRSKQMSELKNFIDFDRFKLLSDAGREKVQLWVKEGLMLDYKIM